MLIDYATIAIATDRADGTFLITENGGVQPYYPAPEYGTHRGYAVGLTPLFQPEAETATGEGGMLIGTWLDPETGIFHIDRVVHVKGSRTDALVVARAFDQKAIYDFQSGEVVSAELNSQPVSMTGRW